MYSRAFDKNIDKEFLTISNYCIGSCHNIFGDDRMETNPEFDYNYDLSFIEKIIVDNKEDFLNKSIKIENDFIYVSKEVYKNSKNLKNIDIDKIPILIISKTPIQINTDTDTNKVPLPIRYQYR